MGVPVTLIAATFLVCRAWMTLNWMTSAFKVYDVNPHVKQPTILSVLTELDGMHSRGVVLLAGQDTNIGVFGVLVVLC